ncbi:MAG: TIGR02266 family protein [Sandaracinaceae bacterium]
MTDAAGDGDGPEGARLRRLHQTGIEAARDARAYLAAPLAGDPERHAHALDGIVSALAAAESSDRDGLRAGLGRAVEGLRRLVDIASEPSSVRTAAQRALALLHSAQQELDRAHLGNPDPTAPFLLAIKRPIGAATAPPRLQQHERRATPRMQLACEVSMTGANVFFAGRTDNVSETGLFVATDQPLPVGTPLLLSFVLPDGHGVRGEGEIAWVRAPSYRPGSLPGGMGIRFVALAARDLRAIEGFLRVRPPLLL